MVVASMSTYLNAVAKLKIQYSFANKIASAGMNGETRRSLIKEVHSTLIECQVYFNNLSAEDKEFVQNWHAKDVEFVAHVLDEYTNYGLDAVS